MTVTLTEAERAYLQSQPLARLATVDRGGAPQNNPVGVFLDEETGDIIIGGHAMGATRKFRNVQASSRVTRGRCAGSRSAAPRSRLKTSTRRCRS
jgi:pyridoxamine 5'-phosphate oxidase family protein